MSHVHAFPMHTYFFSIYLIYLKLLGTFLIVFSLSPPPLLFLFTLVVSMTPKRKSTPAQNILRSGAFSSFDSSPSNVQFRDDDSFKAFLENFSRRGINLECQVILTDFADTDLPSVIHSRGGSHCVTFRSPVLSCLSRSSIPTCTGLII